jgi:hypothetical protein
MTGRYQGWGHPEKARHRGVSEFSVADPATKSEIGQ